jgi:hypothetical protein
MKVMSIYLRVRDSTVLKNKHIAPMGLMIYFQPAKNKTGLVFYT